MIVLTVRNKVTIIFLLKLYYHIPVSDTPNLLKQFHSQLFRKSNLHLITKSQDFIHQLVSHKKSVIK